MNEASDTGRDWHEAVDRLLEAMDSAAAEADRRRGDQRGRYQVAPWGADGCRVERLHRGHDGRELSIGDYLGTFETELEAQVQVDRLNGDVDEATADYFGGAITDEELADICRAGEDLEAAR